MVAPFTYTGTQDKVHSGRRNDPSLLGCVEVQCAGVHPGKVSGGYKGLAGGSALEERRGKSVRDEEGRLGRALGMWTFKGKSKSQQKRWGNPVTPLPTGAYSHSFHLVALG